MCWSCFFCLVFCNFPVVPNVLARFVLFIAQIYPLWCCDFADVILPTLINPFSHDLILCKTHPACEFQTLLWNYLPKFYSCYSLCNCLDPFCALLYFNHFVLFPLRAFKVLQDRNKCGYPREREYSAVLCTSCATINVLNERSVSLTGFWINSRSVEWGMLGLTLVFFLGSTSACLICSLISSWLKYPQVLANFWILKNLLGLGNGF